MAKSVKTLQKGSEPAQSAPLFTAWPQAFAAKDLNNPYNRNLQESTASYERTSECSIWTLLLRTWKLDPGTSTLACVWKHVQDVRSSCVLEVRTYAHTRTQFYPNPQTARTAEKAQVGGNPGDGGDEASDSSGCFLGLHKDRASNRRQVGVAVSDVSSHQRSWAEAGVEEQTWDPGCWCSRRQFRDGSSPFPVGFFHTVKRGQFPCGLSLSPSPFRPPLFEP